MRLKFISLLTLPILLIAQAKDLDKALEEVKEEFKTGFKIFTTEDLFVVASDASDDATDRATRTIEHVYSAMYKDFFEKRPEKPLKVYLFKSDKSYEQYVKKNYNKKPSTPYGFYLPAERKMIMNIATGTGTLAHELVHPLLEEDFPDIPAWFNEGFASLYEQSQYTNDGSMIGLVNWRLPGLKKHLDSVSLADVMKTSRDEFYGDGQGVNYAAARYLCLYMQENKVLAKFYKGFRKNFKDDKTGIKTLEDIFSKKIDNIEKDWKAWVKKLKYE